MTGWETSTHPLANASENLAGQVENRAGQVEFCIGYIRDYPVGASAKFFLVSQPAWCLKSLATHDVVSMSMLWCHHGTNNMKFWVVYLDKTIHQPARSKSSSPGDAIWHHRTGSTLVHVMAHSLTTPSLYPNQCRLIKRKLTSGHQTYPCQWCLLAVAPHYLWLRCPVCCGGTYGYLPVWQNEAH